MPRSECPPSTDLGCVLLGVSFSPAGKNYNRMITTLDIHLPRCIQIILDGLDIIQACSLLGPDDVRIICWVWRCPRICVYPIRSVHSQRARSDQPAQHELCLSRNIFSYEQQGILNFIVDAYLKEAATALSSNTIVRSLFGAGFPVSLFPIFQLFSSFADWFVIVIALQLFATQMYDKLNPRWASTLLGCIALVMIPIPVLFIRYGHILRMRSRYAPTD